MGKKIAIAIALLVVGIFVLAACSMRNKPSPPPPHDWGSNVYIFDPSMSASQITQIITPLYLKASEFTSQRVALFFMPGVYNVSFKLGYYFAVYGLGRTPDLTVINGTVQVCNSGSATDPANCRNDGGNALDNFWRACENITINPPAAVGGTNFWAVSQACAMRRVIINGNLHFSEDNGYSSGGFIADSRVSGGVSFGTQQQFMSRNVDYGDQGGVRGGAWNIVLAGCAGQNVLGSLPPSVTVSVPSVAPIAPKPYLFVAKDDTGAVQWFIGVPNVRLNAVGAPDFGDITVVTNFDVVTTDAQLAKVAGAGGNIIVAPGIYNAATPIAVAPNAVVLGLGMATLLAGPNGAIVSYLSAPAIGARVGGFLLEATPETKSYLLDWGRSTAAWPGPYSPRGIGQSYLYDIYTRVNGSTTLAKNPVSIPAMAHINLEGTVCDNFWLWVADHGPGIPDSSTCGDWTTTWGTIWNSMKCPSCIIVDADNVTAFGLAAEHATGDDLVKWNGANGTVYFFQSELPYHPPDGYDRVAFRGSGANLTLMGGGAYSYFPCSDTTLTSGFVLRPDTRAKTFTRFLNGKGGFGTVGMIDGTACGSAVNSGTVGPSWCNRG